MLREGGVNWVVVEVDWDRWEGFKMAAGDAFGTFNRWTDLWTGNVRHASSGFVYGQGQESPFCRAQERDNPNPATSTPESPAARTRRAACSTRPNLALAHSKK